MATVWHDDLGESPDTSEKDQIEVKWHHHSASEPDFSEVTGDDVNDAMMFGPMRERSPFFQTVYLLAIAGF